MSVKEYYYDHFSELNPEKQFHFATRMNNFFKVHDFNDYLKNNKPDTDIKSILSNNDYSRVSNYALRKPFFEKYPDLFGVEAALFRVHHLLKEYDEDIRDIFTQLYPIDKLYKLADDLLNNEEALAVLSTWAVNVICLTEELFPRGRNVVRELTEWALKQDLSILDATLATYLCTHIVICESEFYTKEISTSQNREILAILLEKCAKIVSDNVETISLDAAVEFLVCCRMIGASYEELQSKINEICKDYMRNSPYLINYRRDANPKSYYHTLDGAEHINALYIMSGLDELNSHE